MATAAILATETTDCAKWSSGTAGVVDGRSGRSPADPPGRTHTRAAPADESAAARPVCRTATEKKTTFLPTCRSLATAGGDGRTVSAGGSAERHLHTEPTGARTRTTTTGTMAAAARSEDHDYTSGHACPSTAVSSGWYSRSESGWRKRNCGDSAPAATAAKAAADAALAAAARATGERRASSRSR